MIFTTAYTSEMVRPLSDAELVDLLVRSRERNAERGITGLLLYRSGRVMQMLEGEEAVVRDLYDRIRMDVRHQRVTNVWSSHAHERRFPTWTMGFEDLDGGDHFLPGDQDPAVGTEPDAFDPALPVWSDGTSEEQDYLVRRQTALRRALVSGDRLVAALAIILNGHQPEVGTGPDGALSLRCRECRGHDAAGFDGYPCPTAKNALWALEASSPR